MGERDTRIKFSVGRKGRAPNDVGFPQGLAFDQRRGLLYVADYVKHRVQVFSSEDGSLVAQFGARGSQPGQFNQPCAVAIDHEQDRIFVSDCSNHRVQVWSLSDQSFVACIGKRGSSEGELARPAATAIDQCRHRIVVADTNNHRVQVLSSIDGSFVFSADAHFEEEPVEFSGPQGVAIDHYRERIIVTDTTNHRVVVLSLIDGSFLFEFSCQGGKLGKLRHPHGVCVDNYGRIIVADTNNRRLQAFTPHGRFISSFNCNYPQRPFGVAFDERRGLIAFTAGNQVHVIGANQWLADTFTWRPDRHRYAPRWMKRAVSTMTMIRSLVDESSAMSMIPNELLFEIFSFL